MLQLASLLPVKSKGQIKIKIKSFRELFRAALKNAFKKRQRARHETAQAGEMLLNRKNFRVEFELA